MEQPIRCPVYYCDGMRFEKFDPLTDNVSRKHCIAFLNHEKNIRNIVINVMPDRIIPEIARYLKDEDTYVVIFSKPLYDITCYRLKAFPERINQRGEI